MPDKLAFSVSATTRKPRPGEENGREYHFLESDDFEKRIENNEFLEHEEVYAGVLYGTLWSEVHKIWDAGKAVVFDVDVQGGLNLKRRFKQDALAIFLRPPSVEILMQRLRKRSTEVEHHLQERIAKANHELSFENQYDVVVVNDVLEVTLKTCEKLVTDFLNKP
jgi:guanylate kinase